MSLTPNAQTLLNKVNLGFAEEKVGDQLAAAAAAASSPPAAATPTTAGAVKQAAHIAPLAAAPSMADFNGLLTALQTAGIMAQS